ncbi:MAG: LTA synthase family protein, partial [Bacteroidales bacterium]|nr:LTA synthase family protein [Bacteroidales bacterium]
MSLKKLIKHPIAQYAVNYLIAFALMMVCRIIFVIANSHIYGDIEPSHYLTLFRGGMKYDFAAIFYLSAAAFFMMIMPFRFALNGTYKRIAKYLFLIPVSIGIFANIFDAAFFPFNGRRTNFSFFNEFQNENNLASIFFGGLVDYWYLALAAAALIFILVKFYYSPKVSADDFPAQRYT